MEECIVKRFISIFLMVIMILTLSTSTFAEFADVPSTEVYASALDRLEKLGIMAGDENGMFNPNSLLTREGFAKIIITASNLEKTAKALIGATVFTDIPVNYWSTGYINAAVDRGYITGRPDGTFNPSGNISFLEICTGIVKALGYSEQDLSGSWPFNYISKMAELGLTEGIELRINDGVPRWIAAVIFDRLLTTPVKAAGADTKTFADATGLYTECIVLVDSTISDSLSTNQITTDKGTFILKDTSEVLEVGSQYAVSIDSGNIVKVFYKLRQLDKIAVLDSANKTITYKKFIQTGTMPLPDDIVYYHNGIKVNYDNLDDIIAINTTIIFAYNPSRTFYEYAVLVDPVYSNPEIAKDYNPLSGKIGNINLSNFQIIRNGEIISSSEIRENDIAYLISDLLRTNQYVLVVDKKAEGEIDAILPNSLAPRSIRINGQTYEFSRFMDLNKIKASPPKFKIGDKVVAVLDRENKVIDIYKPDDVGSEEEIIVLETKDTSSWLTNTQTLTDKGLLYFPEDTTPKLGMKYNVFIKEDKIVRVNEELCTLTGLTIDSIVGNRITYTDIVPKSMLLSPNLTYYHNGSKLSGVDCLKNILQVNTSMLFADTNEGTGYEYAILVDPVFSKPQIAVNFNHTMKQIGDISLTSSKILKNGEIIKVSDIKDNNVIYEVSDFRNTTKYILVLDETIDGIITGILPNKLSPRSVKIDNTEYDLSSEMDYSKITNTTNAFRINDKVKVLLGYDGKVVDIVYTPEDDISNYAYVVNSSQTISTDLKDYGETLYYVKLLHTNGLTATYKADSNPASQKGTLVTFTKTDLDPHPDVEDIIVTLKSVPLISKWKEYNINKNDRMIDNNFVTDNVTIINSVNSLGYGDAEFDFLNWEELPHGTIEEGKIICMNQVGKFDDINLILLNDMYDQKYKYAVITEITQTPDYSVVDMLIDGNQYTYYSQVNVSGEFGSVVKVKFVGGAVESIMNWISPVVQATEVQAVDSRRIRINDVIYPFKEDVNIYFRTNLGSFALKGIDNIDTTRTFGKVSVYLNAPLDERGKVDTIVIYE